MDAARFQAACQAILGEKGAGGADVPQTAVYAGIGTLGEKALHAVIKRYLTDDTSWHEQKLGNYVVDVFTGERIYEVQTRQFNKLRGKLAALLPQYPVTIVYPMPARKWLVWLDPASGELSRPRLSPRRGRYPDVFVELYRIKPFLSHPNLSLLLLQVDLEEYRLLNGWSADRKKGSWRNDRLPLALVGELMIDGPADYGKLLPDDLPDSFTSAVFARAAKINDRRAQTALNILLSLGIVEICGKDGRRRLYRTAAGTAAQSGHAD